MSSQLHHFRLLRVTLEAASAHAIHSGRGDLTHDVLLVRDANGLPTLPGSSLAGVLRHQFSEVAGDQAAARLFGHADPDESRVSRLQVGWGLVHDSRNQPVEGLREHLQSDPLLARLAESKPLVRQRVRLNHRGSAANEGKFDTTLIPSGVRYTCLLGSWGDGSTQDRDDWQTLLGLLRGGLRLGHGTRSGAGLFRVVNLHQGEWNLRDPSQARAYRQRPRSRTQTAGLQSLETASEAKQSLTVTLQLQAEAGWRVGGGDVPLPGSEVDDGKDLDLLPMHEYAIRWNDDTATIGEPQHLLPATAVKGALRHRVAYHYRCLAGQSSDQAGQWSAADCDAVRQLFGYAEVNDAVPGLLHLHDLYLDAETQVMHHNRIDHFTGGVINGALFSEQVLWGTPITLTIELPKTTGLSVVSENARKALQRTLEDLAAGWLPLGAAGGRGLGVFTSPDSQGPVWSDGGRWVEASAAQEETA